MLRLISCVCFTFLVFPFMLLAQDKIHTPAELMEIMETSEVMYEIRIIEKPIEAPDRSLKINLADYYLTEENKLEQIELSEEDFKQKEQAEKHFAANQYHHARSIYTDLFTRYPEYSKLLTYIGQTHHLEGDRETAMKFYQKAIAQNHIDYMAHWFLGRCLLEEGEKEDALKEYLTAHILNRNHPLLIRDLQAILPQMGYEYSDWSFVPQVDIKETEPGKVVLSMHTDWIAYAVAQAVWLYDADFRKKMGLEEENDYSSASDRDALAGFYVMNAENKKMKKKPFFQALDYAIGNKQLDAYLIYETLLPDDPILAYQLTPDNIAYISRYLIDYRFVSKKAKRKNKRKKRR